MKIAICLYGISKKTDSRGIHINWRQSCRNIEQMLRGSHHDIDFFIHTWSTSEKESLIRFFKPKGIMVESSKFPNYKHNLADIKFGNTGHYDPDTKIQSIYSRWDSECKSIKLKREYETENDFKYDFVLSRRFDLLFYEDFNYEDLDQNNFYSSNWHVFWKDDRRYFGYNDAWFVSGTENMDRHSSIIDNLDHFLSVGSSYYNYMTRDLGFDKELILSNHAISRYNLIHEGIIHNERFIGLEYETWNLVRKSNIRKNPHWTCPRDIAKPFNPEAHK